MGELEFKLYIGVKVIRAIPMTRAEVEMRLDRPIGGKETGEGYLVEYPDGYQSWSPKDIFESAYREFTEPEVKVLAAAL
jgi:hypothetical protein